MKGHFYKPNCTCKKKRCTCGAKWAFVVDIGVDPRTGKRKQKKKGGFTTKDDAQKACAKLINELDDNSYVDEMDILFKDFATEWLTMYDDGTLKPGTIRIRKHELARLMDYLAFVRMKDVTRKMYQDALNDLKKKGYADNTVTGAHATGGMIFKKAIALGIIKNNPAEFAKVKKTVKTVRELEEETELPKFLEKEDLGKFLSTAKKHGLGSDFIMFRILAYGGFRVGELIALKIADIDFTEKQIRVTKTYYNPKNNTKKYEIVPPKTKKSKRTVMMDDATMVILEDHIKKLKKAKMRHRDVWHDEGFLFAQMDNFYGYPHLIKTLENRMRRILKYAGLNTSLTPHSLRHTHTSLLAEAGVGLEEIMERLGHIDDDTTRNVYLHVTKEKKKEAPQKFAELMKDL